MLALLSLAWQPPTVDHDSATLLQTAEGAPAGGGLVVSSLTVNAGEGVESKVTLGGGEARYSLSADQGAFVVRNNERTALTVHPDGRVEVHGTLHTRGALRVDGPLNFMGLSQWFLARAGAYTPPLIVVFPLPSPLAVVPGAGRGLLGLVLGVVQLHALALRRRAAHAGWVRRLCWGRSVQALLAP